MNQNLHASNRFISESSGINKRLWRSNLILLISLFILIFIAPLLDHLSAFVTRSSLILVVVSGIYAAEYQKRIFYLLLSLGFMVIITTILMFIFPESRSISVLAFLLMLSSLILSTIALIAHISVARSVERSTIICAINSYLLLGLTASLLFIILDLINPSSFINLDMISGEISTYLYFGFVTLSTLGYGDITPDAPLARSLSIFVAVAGQLYLVIVMALIIGKYLNSERRK